MTTHAATVELWQRRAAWLAWFTIAYNLLEGLVSIAFGIDDDSLSLVGFGVDSLIEVTSAALVLWRLSSEASPCGLGARGRERERTATRWIGRLFIALGAFTAVGAVLRLVDGAHPDTALPGMVISTASLTFMVWLWRTKKRAARVLDSATIDKDADCSRACVQLSAVVLCGSVVFIVAPALWWADAVAALVLAYFITREGWETVTATRAPDFAGGCGCGSKSTSRP